MIKMVCYIVKIAFSKGHACMRMWEILYEWNYLLNYFNAEIIAKGYNKAMRLFCKTIDQ